MNQLLTKTTAGGAVASAGLLLVTTGPDMAARLLGLLITIIGLMYLSYNARDAKMSDQQAGARVLNEETRQYVDAVDHDVKGTR